MALLTEEIKNEIKTAMECLQIVQGAANVMTVLRKHNLLKQQKLLPDEVAVSPSNRDGFGVSPAETHALVEGISKVGWSDSQPNPIAFEICEKNMQAVLDFNERLHQTSDGMLPSMDPKMVRYESLSASHTNACLRCIVHGALHPYPEDSELTVQGKLDLARVQRVDTGLAQAATQGMYWSIVHASVAHEFPQLRDLIQAAANTAGQLSRHEHEWQMSRRIQGMLAKKVDASWIDLKGPLGLTRPPKALFETLPYIFAFLKKFQIPHLLENTESRMKRLQKMDVQLGEQFWKALSSDHKNPEVFIVWFRHAMMSHAYCSPRSLSTQDVRKALSKEAEEKVLKCECLMKKLFKVTNGNQIPKDKRGAADELWLQKQDVLVMHALRNVHGDPEQECVECVDLLETLIGKRVSQEWDAFKKDGPGSSSAAVSSSGSGGTLQRDISEEGGLNQLAVVEELGFVAGANIMRRADKRKATVERLESDRVFLNLDDGQLVTLSAGAFLRNEWKVVKKAKELETYAFDDFKDSLPASNQDFTLLSLRGQIIGEMLKLEEKYGGCLEHLRMTVKPVKRLEVTKAFAKSKLKLVPCSPRVDPKATSLGIPVGDVNGISLWINPSFVQDSFMPAFWLVKRVEKVEDANMIYEHEQTDGMANDGMQIPLLCNSRRVEAGDSLSVYAPAPKKRLAFEDFVVVPKRMKGKQSES